MSQRSPSTYPSYKPVPVTAWMAVAGAGVIPRKATLELPMLPRTAPRVACHAAGREPRCRARKGVAAADLAPTDGRLMAPARALAPNRHCDLAALTPRHPNAIVAPAPVGVIAFVANQQPDGQQKQQHGV